MKIDLSQIGGERGREDTQWYTHGLASALLSATVNKNNRLWLDVGAGLGASKYRIEQHGFKCITQDLAPDLPVDTYKPLELVDGLFEVVSAFDVLEHIEENNVQAFLSLLKSKSRNYVVISSPYDAESQYHFTVFTPQTLLASCSVLGDLVCAYDLHEGKAIREDFNIGQPGAFAALLIFKKISEISF